MSTRLLHAFEKHGNEHFSAFIAGLDHDARIAWYPSAGTDFRPLFFLDEAFYAEHPPDTGKDPHPPDIFLFSDYNLMSRVFEQALFHKGSPIIHDDGRTRVTLMNIENLGKIDFQPYEIHQENKDNQHYFNSVFFFNVQIESAFGTFVKPVLYAFCNNEQLCSELLIPIRAVTSHVIHVRYGHGFGGANCSGLWIQHVLPLLQCEVYIHDNLVHNSSLEETVIKHYGNVIPQEQIAKFETIRKMNGKCWSESRLIVWQLVERDNNVNIIYHYNRELRDMRFRSRMIMRNNRMYNFLV
ncbi:MAG: hypothetical protein EBU66_03850 [Bacteroidetes bacterium]|nr:hypothetical protein [Bacteroidota bacterium]